jgi:hypothetical protein
MQSLWTGKCFSPACGAIGCIYDCRSKGTKFDPYSGQKKVRPFSLSILTDKIFLDRSEFSGPYSLQNCQWWVWTLNHNCHPESMGWWWWWWCEKMRQMSGMKQCFTHWGQGYWYHFIGKAKGFHTLSWPIKGYVMLTLIHCIMTWNRRWNLRWHFSLKLDIKKHFLLE